MKRILAVLLTCILAQSMFTVALAGDIKIYIDGTETQTEVAPVIVNGRTLVPVRAVCEAMDCNVDWDGKTKEVTISHPLAIVKLKIDSYFMKVSTFRDYTYVYAGDTVKLGAENKEIEMDVPPLIINNRTMIPLRAVAEALPASVQWDNQNKCVLITKQYAKQGSNKIVRTLGAESGSQSGESYEYVFNSKKQVTEMTARTKKGEQRVKKQYRYTSAGNLKEINHINENGDVTKTTEIEFRSQNGKLQERSRTRSYEALTIKGSRPNGMENEDYVIVKEEDVWTDYGAWSEWQADPVAGSDTREMQTRNVYSYYYFQCPNCGSHMHGWGITCPTWAGGCGSAYISEGSWHEVYSTSPWSNSSDWYGTGKYYQYIDGTLSFNWTENGMKTQYRFRDRGKEKVYTYNTISAWSSWR